MQQSTIKMYAGVRDGIVTHPVVLTEEELTQVKLEAPEWEFIEMTIENSPVNVGDYWDGTRFIKKKEENNG